MGFHILRGSGIKGVLRYFIPSKCEAANARLLGPKHYLIPQPHIQQTNKPLVTVIFSNCMGQGLEFVSSYLSSSRDIFLILRIYFLQIFNGVFLKVNKATVNMLHRVEPYVTYGYASYSFYFITMRLWILCVLYEAFTMCI